MTGNGGKNCETIAVPGKYFSTFHFKDKSLGWPIVKRIDQSTRIDSIYRTIDGGRTWIPSYGSLNSLNGIHFPDSLNGWVTGDEGVMLHSKDGGMTWHTQHSTVTAPLNSVHFVDNSLGHAVGNQHTIIRTDNGGSTWVSDIVSERVQFNDVYFSDRKTGWACGTNGMILRKKTDNTGNIKTVNSMAYPMSVRIEHLPILPISTTILFKAKVFIPVMANVSVNVYTIRGKMISSLKRGDSFKGWHIISWEKNKQPQSTISKGIYIIRFVIENRDLTFSKSVKISVL